MNGVPHGLRVWDGSGEQVLGEHDFTMRVLGFLQFRDSRARTAPYRVDVTAAKPGVAAILTAVPGTMSRSAGIHHYYSATMPSVYVGDGYLEFRSVYFHEWGTYTMVFDVVLVSTK